MFPQEGRCGARRANVGSVEVVKLGRGFAAAESRTGGSIEAARQWAVNIGGSPGTTISRRRKGADGGKTAAGSDEESGVGR